MVKTKKCLFSIFLLLLFAVKTTVFQAAIPSFSQKEKIVYGSIALASTLGLFSVIKEYYKEGKEHEATIKEYRKSCKENKITPSNQEFKKFLKTQKKCDCLATHRKELFWGSIAGFATLIAGVTYKAYFPSNVTHLRNETKEQREEEERGRLKNSEITDFKNLSDAFKQGIHELELKEQIQKLQQQPRDNQQEKQLQQLLQQQRHDQQLKQQLLQQQQQEQQLKQQEQQTAQKREQWEQLLQKRNKQKEDQEKDIKEAEKLRVLNENFES
jgi:hypothetical protein